MLDSFINFNKEKNTYNDFLDKYDKKGPVQGKIFVCDQCCFGWLQLASDLIDLQMSRLSISNGSRVVTEKLVSLKCL